MKNLLVVLLLIFSTSSFCRAFDSDANKWTDFEGKLGNTKIQLSLYRFDDGRIEGNYCYQKYERKILLKGQIKDNRIELTEYLNGTTNGFFEGSVFTDDLDRFEGTWFDRSKTKKLAFKLTLSSICGSNFEHRYAGFFGTDDDVENFMKHVKSSIAKGNKEWLANHVQYPITTTLSKDKKIVIKNKKQLIENFELIFHPAFKEKIQSACVCNMFNNYKGAMLGAGEIWILNTKNSTENKFTLTIIAINN